MPASSLLAPILKLPWTLDITIAALAAGIGLLGAYGNNASRARWKTTCLLPPLHWSLLLLLEGEKEFDNLGPKL